MAKSDQNNLLLVETIDSVDELNANFYGRFPYPWLASKFEYLHDPRFQTDMLNQAVGDWGHEVVPPDAKIWVAGCGVNQAVFTALKFPQARVVGSDVSETSLELCTETARQLGIKNLELRQESLNHVTYQGEFDHVICTGVIHHNADPQATLEKLSQAMKPTGIMELMVYNRFHWIIPVAFQQAVRTLCSSQGEVDFETELSVTRRIIEDMPQGIMLSRYLSRYNSASPEAMIADELLQPVLYSYTVESLEEMAANCQLEMLLPCLNQFDKETGNFSWNMNFSDPVLRDLYESLPDTRRWHIANLFLMESSPMLWFYMQRTDGGRPRKPERVICEEFLGTVFARTSTTQKYFLRDDEEKYRLSPNDMPFPLAVPDPSVRKIVEAADGHTAMRDIFAQLGLETNFHTINQARMRLTTPVFPYLKAVSPAAQASGDGREEFNFAEVDTRQLAAAKLNKFKNIKPKAIKVSREDETERKRL